MHAIDLVHTRRRAVTVAMFVLAAGSAAGQEARQPDVAITATVRARELRFSRVPEVRVTFRGSVNGVENATVWTTDRQNLPETVQPHVTYRDIGIRLTITSTLPDIERILDEALGPQSRIPPPKK